MKDDEYSTTIDNKIVSFYHNQTNHKMEIIIDFDLMNPYVVTLAKGKAIIAFLKFIEKESK